MAITPGTPITSNFGSTINKNVTLPNLTLAANNLAVLEIEITVQAGVTLPPNPAPTWGSQSFVLQANQEDLTGNAQSRQLLYTLQAASNATNNVVIGFDQFVTFSAAVTPYTGNINTSAPIGTVYKQAQWNSSGWTAPALNVTDSVAGDVIHSSLSSPGWDDGYGNLSGITWTPTAGQSSLLYDQNNSAGGSAAYPRVLASTKAGAAGTVTVGYSKSSGNPAYQHVAFAIKAAAAISIDTITTGGSPGLQVGVAFSITTTGLGTLASVAIKTAATPAAIVNAASLSAPSGDGTAAMPSWVDGQKYPFPGTVTVTATDSIPASAASTFNLSLPDNYISATFGTIVTSNSTYLGYALNAIGKPLATGDSAYWPNVNMLNFATNGAISCLSAMTSDLWIQKVDGTMQYYSLKINNSGQIGININDASSYFIVMM